MLDASVAIAALRAGDANHARATSFLAPLLQGIDRIVVPSIFEVEVVATLVRAGYRPRDARRAADLFVVQGRSVSLGPRGARAAAGTGDDHVDHGALADIVREACGARNGWKVILRRCAPEPHRSSRGESASNISGTTGG